VLAKCASRKRVCVAAQRQFQQDSNARDPKIIVGCGIALFAAGLPGLWLLVMGAMVLVCRVLVQL
jgi:hypothetical protein